MGIKGLNVTIPHKTEVINYLDYLDIAAGLIGAVNTIEFGENGAVGHNTDGIGAIRAIAELTSVKNKKIMILVQEVRLEQFHFSYSLAVLKV